MPSVLNKAIAPKSKYLLIEHCEANPFSIGFESSSNASIQKMKQAHICIFNIYTSNIVPIHFHDICLSDREKRSKTYMIFDAIVRTAIHDILP